MNRLFFGVDGRSIDDRIGNGFVPNILISAGVLWDGKTFRKPLRLPRYETLFLDSGGFSVLQRFGKYPYSAEQYAALARELGASYVSTMDYPCGVKGAPSPKTCIQMTVDASIDCLDVPDVPWVQVIQGGSVPDYLDCCDAVRDAGLETKVLAVGSLVARCDTSEVRSILEGVCGRFHSARMHGFGIGKRHLRSRHVRSLLWSADTTAWRMNSTGERRFPRTAEEKIANFERYNEWVDSVFEFDVGQTSLTCVGASAGPVLENRGVGT